jgi:hypothetical protein
MKRPAFQFYPADWRKDPALSACSLSARGLWIELMCIAHEGGTYGVLSINGKPMAPAQIARMVGESPSVVAKLLAELEDAGVFSRDEQGCIYSRRMVKDEHVRNVRADAGRLGGNPNLLKQKDKQTEGQNPTPSSSYSSSSLENEDTAPSAKSPRGTALPKDWTLPDDWKTWAEKERPDVDVVLAADSFRDFWIGKAGKEGRKADWQATWRNWVRNQRAQTYRKAAPAGDIWAGAVN